jgi:hypothetical protein
MRARSAAAVAGLGLATAGSAFAAAHHSATKEPFRTLARATKETPIHADPGDRTSEGLTVITTINEAQEFSPFLPSTATARLKAANYGRVFVIAAFVQAPLEGYSISVRRVSLVRNARHRRQFCVTATVRRPASNVSTGHGWVGTHLIVLSARPFRTGPVSWNYPTAWVLRTPTGTVLEVSRAQVGSTQTTRVTGLAAACS